MKKTLEMTGTPDAVAFAIRYAPREASKDKDAKSDFRRHLDNIVAEAPSKEYMFALTYANILTGRRRRAMSK